MGTCPTMAARPRLPVRWRSSIWRPATLMPRLRLPSLLSLLACQTLQLSLGTTAPDPLGAAAVLGAGIRAATVLYPDFSTYINTQSLLITGSADPTAMSYGVEIAEKWLASRQGDGSDLLQT